jgi:hypothetical protein
MTAFHLDAAFDLLLNKILLTFRAITANRFVPGDEFALWVTITPIEYPIFLGFPLDDLAFFAHRTREFLTQDTSDSSKIDAKGPAQPHGVALLQGFFRCLWQQEWQNRNAFIEQLQGLVG